MRPITFLLLISVSVLAVVHFFALEFYLYWLYLWLDIPMHVLGGSVVALSLFVISDLGIPFVPKVLTLIPVITIVLLVGLFWEVFEVLAGLTVSHNYWQDTALDLIMDIVGGTIGYTVGTHVKTLE